jgi:hypothetical protein
MLGATQAQIFNTEKVQTGTNENGEAVYDNQITGFKPYQPYSTNVNDYVAGFSPLQQQAMQATGQLGVPSQYGQASRMTNQAGMGSLGLAGQMAGAGQQYAQQAQDPNSMQGYMSPYMQNVVDYQKSQAFRDYGIGQGVRKAQAVGQGAFGGNRQALVESEAQRSLNSQLGGIEAQGAQQAFQNAQQAQQFGANLGMQGRQGALQGLGQYGAMGAQLGQLGGQQLKAQQDVIQSQYGMGQQQQAAEQQKINQAIQDWSNTQQYPLMQLGVMSNMLRGLPMQASTTNQYVAAPNALTQGIGAAGAGASLYNALKGGKEGGLPSEFKSTGIKSYYEGELIESTKSDLYDLPLDELEKRAKSSPSPTIKRLASAIAKEKRMGLAGGGIIAFANPSPENNQGLVQSPQPTQEDIRNAYIADAQRQAKESGYVPPKPAARVAEPMESSNPMGEVSIPDTGTFSGIKNAIVNQYKRDTAGSPEFLLANKQITQAEYDKIANPKSITAAAPTEAAPPAVAKPAAPPVVDKPTAASPVVDKPAAAPAENRGTGIKPNTGLAPNIGGIKGPTGLPAGLEAPVDPDAGKTIAQLAAEKTAYMGPDVGNQEARKTSMAELASAKDEARRTQSMRMAEFFAAWGSTPGSTIVAGLTALKNKAPDFIADAREESKIRRAINKDIAELDKIERLEKSGNYDEAAKRKKELSKNAFDTWGKKVDYLSARETDASRERSAATTAAVRSAGKDDLANLQGRLNTANDNLRKWEDDNSALIRKASRANPKNDPDLKKSIDAAKTQLASNEQYKNLKDDRDAIRRVIDANPRMQNASEGATNKSNTSTSGAGKVIQYDDKGNRI